MDRRAFGLFVSDNHGRDHEVTAEAAFDKDGMILAVRLTGYGNYGAFQGLPLQVTVNAVKNIVGVYRTPLVEVNTKCVLHQFDAGRRLSRRRPARGQLLYGAADRTGGARDEASTRSSCGGATISGRARSLIRRRPIITYDSGDFPSVLSRRRCKAADWNGYAARKATSDRRGKLRGRGIGSLSRSHGAARQGNGRHPLRGERRCHHRHRHARLRPGPRRALRAGAGRSGSAFRSSASAWCRATAIS